MDPQSPPSTIIRHKSKQRNESGRSAKDAPSGILRLDAGKPRRLPTEFKFNQKKVVSPQPSVDRLSVKFANDSLKSDFSKSTSNFALGKMQQQSLQHQQDRVQFPEQPVIDGNESDEDDYSASVNAIIQRRASTRRSKKQSRRASSPFLSETPAPDRRRSSVFTTSSGDTAITVEDENAANEVTQDEIFENIKLHKEVLSNVKMQPWNMRKKLKLVLQAKSYIKKHEGQLQERLAQSHSTKDMLARWNIVVIKKWQKWKREITNMSMWFIPWELKIKEIESHFGSVVASYFIFLRWLFWVNIVIAVVIISFVTIPEIITADTEAEKDRKFVLPEEKYNSTNFLTLWDFEGVFKYSPLFYGWYTNRDYNDSTVLTTSDGKISHGRGYRLPFAYFVTGLVVYAYSFFAILRKMAENSRMSKLSEKDDECIFSWKLFTAWDYMIGNAETAHNRVASIVMGFKEALLEEAEKKRDWKVICFRVLVNSLVAGLLSCSAFAVIVVVKRSTEPDADSTVWRKNEITVVMTLITLSFPMLFEVLGFAEQYHPRKQLRLQLARIMVLNLLNLYSLIFALFDKISDMTILLQEIKTNLSKTQLTNLTLYSMPISSEVTQSSDFFSSGTPCVCTKNFISDPTVTSFDLVSSWATTLSALALPTLNHIAKSFINNRTDVAVNLIEREMTSNNSLPLPDEGFASSVEVSTGPTTFTTYFENSTLLSNDNNTTDISSPELSVNDLKDIFVDYLTFILSPFDFVNASSLESSEFQNLSATNSDLQNFTFEPGSTIASTYFDYFKTTLRPVFNVTNPHEEERFDVELSTLYETISTTISSFLDVTNATYSTEISTDTNSEESSNSYCQRYCQSNESMTSSTTVSSISITSISYGEIENRKIRNYTLNAKLRSLCWETMFGQELIKLTLMDLIVTGLSILMMDFFRGIFVRFMNRCWCWDLEKNFPQYGDFKVAENILHLVNNQGMVWMGMFFSPGLVVLNVIKLFILMYLRTWAVLTCNVPHEIIFRASRSNNFYYGLLLMMLFLCVLPVGYAIVWIEPSWHCGPFSDYQKIFHIFTKTIRANVPESMHRALDYIASPGIVIPLLLLLVLIIYYLVSLTGALREANNDLKTQLRRERTEERRKMFQLADRRRRGGSGESADQTPFSKWKKILGNLPTTQSCDDTRQESDDIVPSQRDDYEEEEEEEEIEKVENRGKVFFARLIKKALGKSSSDEEQDGTDTDQHDSLPYDNSKDVVGKAVSKTNSDRPEIHTLQGIISKWSIRRNSQREDKGKTEDENVTQRVIQSDENTEKKQLHKDVQEAMENPTTLKDAIRASSVPKTKRHHSVRIANIATTLQTDRKEKVSHKHKEVGTRKAENPFLKKILEAKKLGVLDVEQVVDQQPQPQQKHPTKGKRRINKAKKTIIELDETALNEESGQLQREDSLSSNWSETIPVITISKTNSDDKLIEKGGATSPKFEQRYKHSADNKPPPRRDNDSKLRTKRRFVFHSEDYETSSDENYSNKTKDSDDTYKNSQSLADDLGQINKSTSFRPRIKCALKKQVNAIDEDVIIHFGQDLQRAEAEKQMILELANTKIEDYSFPSTSQRETTFIGRSDDDLSEIFDDGCSSKMDAESKSDGSTSEETEVRDDNSVDTILNSPYYEEDHIAEQSVEEQEMSHIESVSLLADVRADENPEVVNKESSEMDGNDSTNLQRPSMRSSSRSQTESSSCYYE
ncbi:transmembrane channel-like protein [Dendroctonus ponderosae]|uniref:transmembrane channel-like protein n=1 Tax=Dendroctonus ponderosae TaxID=77166 RepID=UPI002035A5B8|nr:transmembrane channel-like protein [Dendroctonus ponderosae]